MFQCIKCSISICHLQNLYQVWFISILRRESSSAEIATPQMTFFCARASSDQLHLHWIQSLSAKLQPNMWPVDHGRMQSIISCVSFPNLGWLVFLRNRVSAIWACAWPGHIWAAAVRTRLAPALSCPPLTLSMNCLPAYSSMLSLIHTPICLIQWSRTNSELIGFPPKKLTTQNLWWTITMIFVTCETFGQNELDDWWLCRSFVSPVRCSVSRTLGSFSPVSPFHLGRTIRLGRKDGLLPCWHLLYSWQKC